MARKLSLIVRLRALQTILITSLLALSAAQSGCKSKPQGPYDLPEDDAWRQIAPGENPFVEITDEGVIREIFENAWDTRSNTLMEAMYLSSQWFKKPSASGFYPIAGIEFDRAQQSVDRMIALFNEATSREEFVEKALAEFTILQTKGYNTKNETLFTAYCSVVLTGSPSPDDKYRYPLYNRPADLATDPKTGAPLGRRVGDGYEPYPTRREIEESGMLAGTELVWLDSPLDVFIAQVNGSAKIRLTDGRPMYVGYAGKTDRAYKGLGAQLKEQRLVPSSQLSLRGVRDYFRDHPEKQMDFIYGSEHYVFFRDYEGGDWPAGSLGFRVTEKRSLATDKTIFPRGSLMFVDTDIPTYSAEFVPFKQMMLDQDTGGAIRAAGRADIFMGIGKAAEYIAGKQYRKGKMYYIFLKESATAKAGTGRDELAMR